MEPLVRAAYFARRTIRRGAPLLLVLALAALVVVDAKAPLDTPSLAGWGFVAAALFLLAARRKSRAARAGDMLSDVELALLAGAVVLGVIGRSEGGIAGGLYPLVYVLVALVAAFAHPAAAAVSVAIIVSLEGAIRYVALGERDFAKISTHVAFIVVFALLNLVFVRVEIARIRVRSRARLDAELVRIRDAARSYRLLGATAGANEHLLARVGDEERLAQSSVEEIHQAVLFALELLRRSLDLTTAMLLWLNDAGTHARIAELSSAADNLADGPFLAGDGIIGAVVARRAIVTLDGLKPGYKLPHYAGACPVRTVCGVPVFEHGQVRGVLLADRREGRTFSPQEEDLLVAATRYLVRAIQNERVFVQTERAKVEQGKLYRAAEALGAAITESEVVEAGVASAREIALFDFAAVTLYDDRTRSHEVRAVSGEGTDPLLGARFSHNAGLVAMVVQNRHPLPYKGDFDAERQVVFSKRVAPPKMPSILVLPLLVHDRPLGTLVLGAKRKGAFGDAVRPTLEVLASHMAVSLANARMVRKLEELATTDGLTGLLNKRAMTEAAQQKIAAATRLSRKLSVLITDIDFFKKVNDTHGHDVGDVVIRGLADILRRARHGTDIAARFGGEEFVIVCEEADPKGAMLLAERVRTELEATTFHTPNGPLKVTCSVGIATFPEAGRDWDALFKSADEALYLSKRSGRNRSTAWTARRKGAAA